MYKLYHEMTLIQVLQMSQISKFLCKKSIKFLPKVSNIISKDFLTEINSDNLKWGNINVFNNRMYQKYLMKKMYFYQQYLLRNKKLR